MPIHEYHCESCNCMFEYLKLKEKDPDPLCPTCCSDKLKKMISAGWVRPGGIATGSGGLTSPNCKPSGG